MQDIYSQADPKVFKILVGNKVDMIEQRVVSKDEAEEVAAKYKMAYFETSAKMNININETLKYVMDGVYNNVISAAEAQNK